MKKSLFALLFCVIFAGLSSCKKEHPREDSKKKIQSAVDKIRENMSDTLGISFPSLSLLIQTPTDKIFVSSRGESGQVVTPDTYYRFGSITKNFTSTAILNMWEDGWLDYKAKITDVIPGSKLTYVPSTADWDFPYKNEITIEQLMQNAAGVFDIDNDPVPGYNGLSYREAILKANPMHQFTTGEMVKVLTEKNISYFRPGEGWHYSNTGYSILAEIIERVYTEKAGSNKNHADYMEDYLTGDHTPVPLPKTHFPDLATDIAMPDPHLTSAIIFPEGTERYDKYNVTAQIGQGNGYGTMEESNKYIRTLMKGDNVLNPATVQLMQKDFSAANSTYALGCSFIPNIGYGHTGSFLGFLTLLSYDPDYDVSLVVMVPLADFRSLAAALTCLNAMTDAAYAAREVLGYPGKP